MGFIETDGVAKQPEELNEDRANLLLGYLQELRALNEGDFRCNQEINDVLSELHRILKAGKYSEVSE